MKRKNYRVGARVDKPNVELLPATFGPMGTSDSNIRSLARREGLHAQKSRGRWYFGRNGILLSNQAGLTAEQAIDWLNKLSRQV